ncbi:hypothetical protein EKH82_01025 [Pantoea dispersa]|nr:fimbrial protein [Pantoea sp. Ap-959]PPC65831.1 hypothetical protein C1Y43_19300 [Pantoea sp. ICBG 828]PPC67967.1 hypothetical protein C1Y42_20830 [Pantoea sp. ICBG 985]RVU77981.1 hypothetical protein EKH82_01025 [Pantoea dispersa]
MVIQMSKIIFFGFLCFILIRMNSAIAGLEESCWTEPTQLMVLDTKALKFNSYKKGAESSLGNRTLLPRIFPVICNKSKITRPPGNLSDVLWLEGDMGPLLTPSDQNNRYYKLTDDIDVAVLILTNAGTRRKYLPVTFNDDIMRVIDAFVPVGRNVSSQSPDFSSETIYFKLRRDVIGGAVVIPGNIVVATLYSVDRFFVPLPPRPDKPLAHIITDPLGVVIPVPIVCNINEGNALNVEFGRMVVSEIPDAPVNDKYSQDVPLHIKCNSLLNQDAAIQLATGVTDFSSDLIATSNKDLGVAVFHRGQLMKPYQPSPVKLVNGEALETITLSPVKRKGAKLSGGEFTASATVIVTVM